MNAPFRIKNIIAPTDLSAASAPALRYARLFAERFDARLTILYSDPVVYPVDVVGPSAFVTPGPEHEARLRSEVVQYVSELMGRQPYEIRITTGLPVPAILESAKEHGADLIVVGTHLHHGFRRVFLGSTSDGVLYSSECPVLAVAADGHPIAGRVDSIKTIVCPVNFTDVARESLRAAARLAQTFNAQLLVVHVVEADEVTDTAADERRVRHWVTPILEGSTTYRELIVRGSAAERVLDCAEDAGAGLIVVGAQHKYFRSTTVIGATADRLIRFASCPVFVVPRQPVAAAKQERKLETVEARW